MLRNNLEVEAISKSMYIKFFKHIIKMKDLTNLPFQRVIPVLKGIVSKFIFP